MNKYHQISEPYENKLHYRYRLFQVLIKATDIAVIPFDTDGKFRVRKLKVIKELQWSKAKKKWL